MSDASTEQAVSAPITEAPATTGTTADITPVGDNPVSTVNQPAAEKVEAPKKVSVSEAIKNATDKVNRNEKDRNDRLSAKEAELNAAKNATKTATKEGELNPAADQKQKTKTGLAVEDSATDKSQNDKAAQTEKSEAPIRFSPEAKDRWERVPEEVRRETIRVFQELEKGIEKYKQAAVRDEALREHYEFAAKHGTDLKTAFDRYVAVEKGLISSNNTEKLASIDEVFRVAKISPQEYAAYILGQSPDQRASEDYASRQAMQAKMDDLQRQVAAQMQYINQQRQQEQQSYLQNWAKDRPLAESLAPQITHYVSQGLHLDEAYVKAEQDFHVMAEHAGLIPRQLMAQVSTGPVQAQTLKGIKSITGAPGAGSNPATQKPSSSISEAVARAYAKLN